LLKKIFAGISMSKKVSFPLIVLTFICSFYMGLTRSQEMPDRNEVVFDDGYRAANGDETIIDDSMLQGGNQTVSTTKESIEEPAKILADNSKISVMYDGFGNKTETRSFNNHLRIGLVLLKTSVNGTKTASVYGRNGQEKILPETMLNMVLTASADEIANAAGIYESLKLPAFSQKQQSTTPKAVQPVPGYNTPAQPTQDNGTQTQEVEQNKEPQVKENSQNPGDGEESVVKNRQPSEEN
jgi:hypothetical protein